MFPLGTTDVTLTSTDASGNESITILRVTVVDTTAPTITAPPDVTAEQASAAGAVVAIGTPTVTDLCDVDVTITSNAPDVFPLGETTVRWTATDGSGNSAEATHSVTVVDTTPPALTVPADITAEQTSADGTPVDTGVATTTDICDSGPVVISDAPDVFPLGPTVVTWTATDLSGNSTSATQTITVVDTTPPSLTPPADLTAEQVCRNGTAVEFGAPIVSDLCDTDVAATNDAPDVFPLGATTVTWTAEDDSGNVATATQTVTIKDTTPPTLVVPGDRSAEQTSSNGTPADIGQATAIDVCDGDVTITNDAPAVFPLGATTVTWTAIDDSGNDTTAAQTVTIVDTIAPVLTVPADIMAEQADANGTAVDLGQPTVADICDTEVAVTNNAPAVFPLGETFVAWTATDDSGNASIRVQIVTIVDTTPPALTLPASITVEQTALGGTASAEPAIAVLLASAGATDICDATPTVTHNAPPFFQLGVTTVTFTATDASGNSATGAATVTVDDTTEPGLVAPAAIQAEQLSADGTPVNLGLPQVCDTCDCEPVVTNDAPAVFPLGDTVVTWTATDDAGNVATAEQLVTIVDTTSPVLSAPPDLTVDESDPAGTPVDLGQATAADICDANVTITNTAPAVFPLGDTIVTWTATDDAGNSATAQQTVTVVPGPPANQLDNQSAAIDAGVASGDIAPELEGSLDSKVDSATDALARGNPNDAKVAMNELKSLINQVEAQEGKKITPEAAAEIIERANSIIAALGG